MEDLVADYPELGGFLTGIESGSLRISQCDNCQSWQWPPYEACSHCGGPIRWSEVRPQGTVYSWVVVHHSTLKDFEGKTPYVVALVALDDAPIRIMGLLTGVEPGEVSPDLRVTGKTEQSSLGPRVVWNAPSHV